MKYTCDHSPDRTEMCLTCMNYESKIHTLEAENAKLKEENKRLEQLNFSFAMSIDTTVSRGEVMSVLDRIDQWKKELVELRAENKALKEKADTVLNNAIRLLTDSNCCDEKRHGEKLTFDNFKELGGTNCPMCLTKANKSLALQLAAMREALEKIKLSCKFAIEKIANSNPEKEYLIPEKVLDLILPILSTPISALVAQMEKKLEAAGKMAEALRDYEWLISELEMFKRRPEFTRALERIAEALALWNTANEVKP